MTVMGGLGPNGWHMVRAYMGTEWFLGSGMDMISVIMGLHLLSFIRFCWLINNTIEMIKLKRKIKQNIIIRQWVITMWQ